MKRSLAALVGIVVLACVQTASPTNAATYAFHDEFSGTSLNTSIWTAQTGELGGLCTAASNARVFDGYLRMTVRKGTTADCPWVGARLVTQDKRYLDYGHVKARVKWNPAPGFWGGFVMFGRASGGARIADGEIDTEIRNGMIHYRLWSVNSAGSRCGVAIDKPHNGLDRWHTFGINRQPTYTQFFLDGVKQATITKAQMTSRGCTWPFERRFSLVLSARAGGWGGTPDPTRYPVTTLVDWVRQ
jgi:beta-glucanase (GH16 family)